MTLIKLLHPTPAVAGLPKQLSIQWLKDNEGYNRSYYAGYLGIYSKKSLNLFVNLRCMQWKSFEQLLYVGCGIINGSNPEKEYLETLAKAQTMLGILNK